MRIPPFLGEFSVDLNFGFIRLFDLHIEFPVKCEGVSI